jgi:hypothetical protein
MTLPPAAILSAPLPIPRRFGLLDAATVVLETGRFPVSATIEDYPAGEASVQVAGASGSLGIKTFDAVIDEEDVKGFTVYLGVECTTLSAKRPEFRQRLQAAFRAVEGDAVERMLVDADGTLVQPYLTDANMQNFGAAVSVVEGIAQLENAIARVGNGMIHVTPGIATAMEAATLLQRRTPNIMETVLGTVVVVGAGYIGAYPQGGSAPTGDQEWAFASAFVEVHRDEDQILGPTIGQSMDRSTNDVQLIAERNYLLAWVGRQAPGDTHHIQSGVLIDRSA